MNQKFEKFKSKEISKAESEKVIGGDIFDCVWDCEAKALLQCEILHSDPADVDYCLFKKQLPCITYCMDQEIL